VAKPLDASVIIEQPRVEQKDTQFTIGIRKRILSKTIASAIPNLLKQTETTLASRGFAIPGAPFFRFHSINMGVEYDFEVGFLCKSMMETHGIIVANTLPGGNYVTIKYAGKNRGYQGNKALIEWAKSNQYELDRWHTELGDTFFCRYEVYLTDFATEPDHKKWVKEVAIKIK
jgi:effector-binding domain-containing protein